MEKVKEFLLRHFEKFLVLSILLGIVVINYFVSYKIGFLNFFYLPIIIAGYYLGKRMAVLTAFFCVLIVIIFFILYPSSFLVVETSKVYVIFSLIAWSSFLILTSTALGYLYEEKEKRISELKSAYVGILEIMSRYLESADRYTKGHSVRVAHLSEDIARVMRLSKYEIDNIKAAALLHDIGKAEISMEILNKAASLTSAEKELIASHTEKGAEILSLMGGVLKEAVPIVSAHHKFYFENEKSSSRAKEKVPIGAAILAVADAFDAIITDRPYRAGKMPRQAFEEIEKESGRQFHPEVVRAFKKVLLTNEKYRKEEPEAFFH